MYFKRDIEEDLLAWKKDKSKCVLEIQGARQVGKTTTLLHFAKNNYTNIIYINMIENTGTIFLELCENELDVVKLLSKYSAAVGKEFTDDENTVVIIDEIQESEKVYTMIRQFNRQTNCDVIVTGSYLGKTKNYFQPVGDVEKIEMLSMSFAEFIGCYNGAREFYENINLDCSVRDRFDWFDTAYQVYQVIGGYPAVVKAYLENRDYKVEIKRIYDTLISELQNRCETIEMYERIPIIMRAIVDLAIREKKGIKAYNEKLTNVIRNYNAYSVNKEETYVAINWLLNCGVIGYCNKINLVDNTSVDGARFYIRDIGMLNYVADMYDFDESNLRGLRSETFVYQSLMLSKRKGIFATPLPEFGVYGDYEYDFVIKSKRDGARYIIEVKSGRSNSKSVQKALAEGKTDYVVFYKGDTGGGIVNNVITLPIWLAERFEYCEGRLRPEQSLQRIESF